MGEALRRVKVKFILDPPHHAEWGFIAWFAAKKLLANVSVLSHSNSSLYRGKQFALLKNISKSE